MGVFFLFLLALAAGSLTTLYWIPEDDLGRGYYQTNALVILGLLGLAACVFWLHPFAPFGAGASAGRFGGGALLLGLAGAFLYYAAIWRERWLLSRWAATASLAGVASALILAGTSLTRELTPLPHREVLLWAALVTSALLLGWSLITMLLGHWYLVSPRLTFRHLTLFCWVLVAVVGVRVLTVGASVASAATVDALVEPHPLRILTGFSGQGMFFWFRVLWGLGIPLVLAILSLHCARQRSNQSATGILYVVVVGSLIGEITALYVTLTTGVPI